MPVIHHSTIKRARQAEVRRQRNRSALSLVKGAIKKVTTAVEEKNVDAAKASLRDAASTVGKAVTKGLLKPNTGSRRISRLTKMVNGLSNPRT